VQIVDCGLWIADCGLRIADCGLWIADCGEYGLGFIFRTYFVFFVCMFPQIPYFLAFCHNVLNL